MPLSKHKHLKDLFPERERFADTISYLFNPYGLCSNIALVKLATSEGWRALGTIYKPAVEQERDYYFETASVTR